MQNIKAKKEALIRILGTILILIGFLATVVFSFFAFNVILYVFILLIVLPWFLIIILLKMEKDFIVENQLIILIVMIVYSVIMLLIGSVLEGFLILLTFSSISNILILLCWHFALSIYKKEKLFFLICGIGYFILTSIFLIPVFISKIGLFLAIAPLISIIVGMLFILAAETRMRKKQLLNYI